MPFCRGRGRAGGVSDLYGRAENDRMAARSRGNMSDQIAKVVEILKGGGLVAFPTETVYGLGADATNSAAVERIYLAKGRPNTNPSIVHIADAAQAGRFARVWPPMAAKLAAAFWPGALTLVVQK